LSEHLLVEVYVVRLWQIIRVQFESTLAVHDYGLRAGERRAVRRDKKTQRSGAERQGQYMAHMRVLATRTEQ
jgi:hypothetical protein